MQFKCADCGLVFFTDWDHDVTVPGSAAKLFADNPALVIVCQGCWAKTMRDHPTDSRN